MTTLSEIPLNLEDYPIPEKAPDGYTSRDGSMRLLISAARMKNRLDYAYYLVLMLHDDGKDPAEILQAAIDTQNPELIRIYTSTVNRLCYPKKTVWTYERRLALHIIGAMAVGYPGLSDGLWKSGDSPSALHNTIDEIANALIDGMHTLGCPEELSLSQILDYASSYRIHHKSA